jgi:hypothetical protein
MAGRELKDCVYVEGDRVVVECCGDGDRQRDMDGVRDYLASLKIEAKSEAERGFMIRLEQELNREDWQIKNVCDVLDRFQNIFV